MTDEQLAVEMLRKFSTFQSFGIRGIARFLRMQADANKLLAKIDKKKA